MDDSIYIKQNDDFLLSCLKAQRREYTCAKHIALIKTLLTFAGFIVSVIGMLYEQELLSALIYLFSMSILICNKYSDQKIKTYKIHAASIQQYVDVTLFSSAIGNQPSEWGELPTKTELSEAVSKVQQMDSSAVRNWYNDYSSLPSSLQVFYCQRENIRWNFRLYRSFLCLTCVLSLILVLLLLSVMFIMDASLIRVICFISWITPLLEYFVPIIFTVKSSVTQMRKLDSFCNKLEAKMEKEGLLPSENELIELQGMIRKKRETCYLIPDWFYNLTKNIYQDQEDSIAENISSLIVM